MSRPEIIIPSEFKRLFDDDWREAAVYGGRNSLKSHTVARILLVIAAERKIRTGCFREFQNSIADSSHQLLADLIEQYELDMFVVTKDSIVNTKNGSDFLFRGLHNNIQSIKSIEGIDYAWVEEAQTITEDSLEVLVPTVRKPGSKLIYTYNRLTELDPIHKRLVIDGRPDVLTINVNYDVAIKYGWLTDDQIKAIEFDKEHNPALYEHKWLGQPIEQSENSIISRTDILEAMNRIVSDVGGYEMGVDVARFGDDRTVIWLRKGLKTLGYRSYQKLRTTEVCDKIEEYALEKGIDKPDIIIKIDETGVGGGVVDELVRRKWTVYGINNAAEPHDSNKYPNLISEGWFHLKDIMPNIQLPYNDGLLMELSNRLWGMDNRSRRVVESKKDYKKRGWRSPDLADACILCYYNAGSHIPVRSDDEVKKSRSTLLTSGLSNRSF